MCPRRFEQHRNPPLQGRRNGLEFIFPVKAVSLRTKHHVARVQKGCGIATEAPGHGPDAMGHSVVTHGKPFARDFCAISDRSAMAIFSARSARSRFRRSLTAQPINRKGPALFFDEPKTHGFWLAKNWEAFLGCPSPPSGYGPHDEVVHSPAQARGPRQRLHPYHGARSPICSRSKSRPPDHP